MKKAPKIHKLKYADHEVDTVIYDGHTLQKFKIDSKISDIIVCMNEILGFKTLQCCSGHLFYNNRTNRYEERSDFYIMLNYTKSYNPDGLLKFVAGLPRDFITTIDRSTYTWSFQGGPMVEADDVRVIIRSDLVANTFDKIKLGRLYKVERNKLRLYINDLIGEEYLKMEE